MQIWGAYHARSPNGTIHSAYVQQGTRWALASAQGSCVFLLQTCAESAPHLLHDMPPVSLLELPEVVLAIINESRPGWARLHAAH